MHRLQIIYTKINLLFPSILLLVFYFLNYLHTEQVKLNCLGLHPDSAISQLCDLDKLLDLCLFLHW